MNYKFLENKVYLCLNKPCGYVCSAVSDSHKTVYQLLSENLQKMVQLEKRGNRLHTVGRLDCNTSGLLLITNDGVFSNYLTRSENHIEKSYFITLESAVLDNEKKIYSEKCLEGFYIPEEKKGEAFTCKSSHLVWEDDFHCRLTISEGKFHQVRRMIRVLGNEVMELKRVSFGDYSLGDLKEGEVRDLSLL